MSINTFTRDGIQFRYPKIWEIETETSEDAGWTVTLRSPETAMVLVSYHPEVDDPQPLAEETLESLRSDYPTLDAEPVVESLAGRAAVGYDIDFLTVDTPVTCMVRILSSALGTLVLLTQTSDYERIRSEPVFRTILQSVSIDDG